MKTYSPQFIKGFLQRFPYTVTKTGVLVPGTKSKMQKLYATYSLIVRT